MCLLFLFAVFVSLEATIYGLNTLRTQEHRQSLQLVRVDPTNLVMTPTGPIYDESVLRGLAAINPNSNLLYTITYNKTDSKNYLSALYFETGMRTTHLALPTDGSRGLNEGQVVAVESLSTIFVVGLEPGDPIHHLYRVNVVNSTVDKIGNIGTADFDSTTTAAAFDPIHRILYLQYLKPREEYLSIYGYNVDTGSIAFTVPYDLTTSTEMLTLQYDHKTSLVYAVAATRINKELAMALLTIDWTGRVEKVGIVEGFDTMSDLIRPISALDTEKRIYYAFFGDACSEELNVLVGLDLSSAKVVSRSSDSQLWTHCPTAMGVGF